MIQVNVKDPVEQRRFGLVMAAAFLVLGALRSAIHWFTSGAWEWSFILFGIAAAFAVAGLLYPRALQPVFAVWIKFSLALNWVMTRLFLAVAFYILLSPIRVVFALKGEDELKRAWRTGVESYWEAAEPQPDDIRQYRNQF